MYKRTKNKLGENDCQKATTVTEKGSNDNKEYYTRNSN